MVDASDLSDHQRRQIESAKRTVWAQEGAGERYQGMAYRDDPIIRLKNLTEIGFILRCVRGPRVLDAGAGTGRFTLPLAQAGFSVAGLDISREMLLQGRAAAKSDQRFPGLQGDIERLPFPDEAFDSVISVTVVRHFPNWRGILDEYLRVVRPGGRLLFDLASEEQQRFGEEAGMPRPHAREGFDPLGYDNGATYEDIAEYAAKRGLSIAAHQAHDVFNSNPLIEHVLGPEHDRFMEELRKHLAHEPTLRFCEMAHRRFLGCISPAACASVLVVLDRTPGASIEPAHRMRIPEGADTADEALLEALRARLGRRYGSFMREAARHCEDPRVAEFVQFCRERLLARWPVKALV